MTSKSAPLSNSTEIEKQAMMPQDEFALADEDVPQERFYLEMFHRAMAQEDDNARTEFQLQVGETVRGWLRLHFTREMPGQDQQEEYYVAQTFACFWQISSRYKETGFSTLAAILQCLQASLNSTIIESQRASLCSITANATMLNNDAEVWKIVQSLLTNTRQQRIAYLLFHCGLKPSEIVHSYPEEFSNVLEVTDIRNKILTGTWSSR